eukprot:SAG11_NODE_2041_length_3888_cov_5.234099_2_plen_447_part_00
MLTLTNTNACGVCACLAKMLLDTVRNGDESDVDCGGSRCDRCADGSACWSNADCGGSALCEGSVGGGGRYCVSCFNNITDGSESGVDCGGATCAQRCGIGGACGGDSDCATGFCSISAAASTRYGALRFRPAAGDSVLLPTLGSGRARDTVTIDAWVLFHSTVGSQVILNDDGWSRGDVHYQIFGSLFGIDVNGNGDQTFAWQPQTYVWYYLSVVYSVPNDAIMLRVDYQHVETIGHARTPITFDSPRLGAWYSGGQALRTLDGRLGAVRIWDTVANMENPCVERGMAGLLFASEFSDFPSVEWMLQQGYYVIEGHTDTSECYALEEAKLMCLAASDCHAIATQSNVCSGQYRVTHGGPTLTYYNDWATYDLHAYSVTRTLEDISGNEADGVITGGTFLAEGPDSESDVCVTDARTCEVDIRACFNGAQVLERPPPPLCASNQYMI